MFWLFIAGGVILLVLVLLFFMAFFLHRHIFGKRWEPDGIVKYYTLEEYENLHASPIKFLHKGKYLQGFLYSYPAENYKGIAVFSHGMWGSHKAYLQEMEVLASEGYKVLGFDNYGTELSAGRNIRGLGSSLACLISAVTYVKNNYPNEKIFIMGHSWGGFAASCIAKYHPDLEAIVCMSPFLSIRRAFQSFLPRGMHVLIPFLILVDVMYCGRVSMANAVKILSKTKIKTFLLHSKDDGMVKYHLNTGYLQQKVTNDKLTYFIVEGKHHNPDYSMKALEYTTIVSKKLKELSPNQKEEFRRQIDYHQMGELDEMVMQKIVDFLNS